MAGNPVGAVHVNAYLSNLGRQYVPNGFIADRIAPYLDVQHESDLYPVWTQGDWFATDVDDLVPDRAEPRYVEGTQSTEQYQTRRRELAWDISDRERKNADAQIRLEANKQNFVLARLAMKREQRVAALARTVTNGGQIDNTMATNAAAKWDNAATTYQSIFGDVMLGRQKMRQAIGIAPNKIVLPAAVAEGMNKSLLFNAVQYTIGGEGAASQSPLTAAFPLLPPVLWGMEVIVAGQITNTAAEGQTAAYSDIWGEEVRLLYVTDGPATENPSFAYTFRSEPFLTRQWREEKRRVDAYAAGQTIDERVVAPFAAYVIQDCLT